MRHSEVPMRHSEVPMRHSGVIESHSGVIESHSGVLLRPVLTLLLKSSNKHGQECTTFRKSRKVSKSVFLGIPLVVRQKMALFSRNI